MLQSGYLKLLTWCLYIANLRNGNPKALAIEKKEDISLLNEATQRAGPLIGDIERPREAERLKEAFVRIENGTVPVVLGVPVELAGSRLRYVVYVSACSSTEVARIAGAHDARFFDLVLTQEQTQGPRELIMEPDFSGA